MPEGFLGGGERRWVATPGQRGNSEQVAPRADRAPGIYRRGSKYVVGYRVEGRQRKQYEGAGRGSGHQGQARRPGAGSVPRPHAARVGPPVAGPASMRTRPSRLTRSASTSHSRRSPRPITSPYSTSIPSASRSWMPTERSSRSGTTRARRFRRTSTERAPVDAIQVAYFTSAAVWNYLTEPFVFARPDVWTREIDPWDEDGETWRRLGRDVPEEHRQPTRRTGLLLRRELHATAHGLLTRRHRQPARSPIHARPQDLRRIRLPDPSPRAPPRQRRQREPVLCRHHRRHPGIAVGEAG